MTQLFELIVHPMASPQTDGAFLGGLRVMAVDGTVIDVPDSPANAKVFGYPGTGPGTKAAFPKVRLVLLVETGTHLIVDARQVSISDWGASSCSKTPPVSYGRNAADVG